MKFNLQTVIILLIVSKINSRAVVDDQISNGTIGKDPDLNLSRISSNIENDLSKIDNLNENTTKDLITTKSSGSKPTTLQETDLLEKLSINKTSLDNFIATFNNSTNNSETTTDLSIPSITSVNRQLIGEKIRSDIVPVLNRDSCTDRKILDDQPIQTEFSKIKKCCPFGESLKRNANARQETCETDNIVHDFKINVIEIILYEDCIEDTEKPIGLITEVINPCNISAVYGREQGDALYIIQNGSILITDLYGNESFMITNNYCMDQDYLTGEMQAIVCGLPIDAHMKKAQSIICSALMIVSIPCLIFVSFIHFRIRELRNIHGICLATLALCFATGLFFHTIAQFSNSTKTKLGYVVQYFMLSYFFWLLTMTFNILILVWYYIPRYIMRTKKVQIIFFSSYFIFSMGIPLWLVLVTKSKGLSGMPSYFYQGITTSVRSSQTYFIPPVCTVLIACFILLIGIYFGFRKLQTLLVTQKINELPVIDQQLTREVKKDAKCITILTVVIITTWIMEMVTFYSIDDYLAFLDIINSLQGVFILIIFVILRNRRTIITRWWHDRGSHIVTETEMINLNTKQNGQEK